MKTRGTIPSPRDYSLPQFRALKSDIRKQKNAECI
jgi:hypothetical protein